MSTCKGIFGIIFGHNYKPVFDEDKENRDAQEIERLLGAATRHNFWSFEPDTKVATNTIMQKRITKVYIGHVCTRCGDCVKFKNTII